MSDSSWERITKKARSEARAGYEYQLWHAKRYYMLGPWLESSVENKKAVLCIPMPKYSKEVWTFWRNKGFRWVRNKGLFMWGLPSNADMQAWMDRARKLYYVMWDNVNEGKEWNENLGT